MLNIKAKRHLNIFLTFFLESALKTISIYLRNGNGNGNGNSNGYLIFDFLAKNG